jgi:hypothetical protein
MLLKWQKPLLPDEGSGGFCDIIVCFGEIIPVLLIQLIGHLIPLHLSVMLQ